MLIITATSQEIRDNFFSGAESIPMPFSTAESLVAVCDTTCQELCEALLGWPAEELSTPYQIGWFNPERLAVVIYTPGECYLFTFSDSFTYQEGAFQIRQLFAH